jgi:hypothetical protein
MFSSKGSSEHETKTKMGSSWEPEVREDVTQKNVERKALREADIIPSLPNNPHEMKTSMDKENDFLLIIL